MGALDGRLRLGWVAWARWEGGREVGSALVGWVEKGAVREGLFGNECLTTF